MLSYLTLFLSSFIVAFSGAMMPGPLMTATISESSKNGPWVGPRMMAGHAILEILLITAIFLGMAPLFKKEMFFIVVAFAGGVIMIVMAAGMLRSLPGLKLGPGTVEGIGMNHYLAGILMSLANPYWIIWWATIGLGYVTNAQKFGFAGIAAFYTGHITGDMVWYTSLSFAFGKGKKFFGNTTYRILVGLCAIFLACFSAWLIYDGLVRLLRQ